MLKRDIWVLPELVGKPEEVNKLSLGLLTEARSIADKVAGQVTALVFGARDTEYNSVLSQYGISRALIFRHPQLSFYSAEVYCEILTGIMRNSKPWLFLMGNTLAAQELLPRLAIALETGVVADCVKMDLSSPDSPVFYRPTLGGQAYQELVFPGPGTMLVTMNPDVLNQIPSLQPVTVTAEKIVPELSQRETPVDHLACFAADFTTVDVADAEIIVAAGAGAAAEDLLPLVEELAGLIEGAIGTTRPVIDEGKIARERMIGQTGKVVSPALYLALGISGATHHVGGIQDSSTVVAVNQDPQAAIFQNADLGVIADLRMILPGLINKIKQARKDGQIL